MRLLALFAGAVATAAACGGRQAASSLHAGDAEAPPASATVEDAGGLGEEPMENPTFDAGSEDAGSVVSPDGSVCPAGMSLCDCRGSLYCASACNPLPCLPPTPVPSPSCLALGASEECICYATTYCGADCQTACDPRPADSGWCSEQYGAVRADEADATAAAPCSGLCIEMLELDAAANGEIPVAYGCGPFAP